MLHKAFDAVEFKADGDTGTFEATVAVFGNVDSGGDRILPGAFAKSLEKWRATGDPIPIILSHQHNDPMAHIGVADPHDVTETTKGLFVKGQLDIADNEVARQVHKLMMRRSLKEFSFGYTVPKGGEKRAKDGANDVSLINLIEAGPTLKGMNPETELHAVKSALETKQAGDQIESLKAELAEAKAALSEATEKLEAQPDPDKEPRRVRSADPNRRKYQRALLDEYMEGVAGRRPSPKVKEPEPAQTPPEEELRRRSRDAMLETLIGRSSTDDTE